MLTKDKDLSFKEIFDNDGLYKSESFRKGYAFKITNGNLKFMFYSETNTFGTEMDLGINKRLFHMKYEYVYTRQSLLE